MQLRLKAQAAHANESPPATEALFGTDGGTLGRDPKCHMVLVDPMRRISRIQGQIIWESGSFHLINASTSNPIYVNGRELGPGATSVISEREEWRTGNFLIAVERLSSSQPSAPPVQASSVIPVAPVALEAQSVPAPRTAVSAPATSALDFPHPASAIRGPFDDLLSTPVNPVSADPSLSPPPLIPEPLRATAQQAALPGDPFALEPSPAIKASRAQMDQFSVGDPFADLMGAPIDSHLSSAPAHESFANARAPHPAHGGAVIPNDFNPMSLGGVAHRNNDDPLKALLEPGHVKDMFPERSLDAIFQPTDGLIESMTTDPIQAAHHQAFLDASTKVDPLAIFSEQRTEDSLNPEFFQSVGIGAQKTHSDHTSELGSYFRAPRAMEAAASTPNKNTAAIPEVDLSPYSLPPTPSAPPSPSIAPSEPAHIAPAASFTPSPLPAVSSQAVDLNSLFDLSSPVDGLMDWSTPSSVDAAPMPAEPAVSPATLPDLPPQHAETAQACEPPSETPFQPRDTAQPGPAAAPPQQAQTPTDSHAQQLLEAFKRGAGLNDCRYPQQLTPEVMHMIGQMLGSSVQGCMDLLSSRAAAKQEVRIAVTLINAEANNPLKFLPTGASALAQIFGPKMPGFLNGPAAIENAHSDLRSHEVGMMAGTQAAVQGLFERFAPQVIEQQLDAQGRQRTLFAAQRNARLWDMYCSHYKWLKDEMKNQTPASWGSEFHSAYHTELSSMDNKGSKQ